MGKLVPILASILMFGLIAPANGATFKFSSSGCGSFTVNQDSAGDFVISCVTGNSSPVNTDTDTDGVLNSSDNCPSVANPGQEDDDGDNVGNACDAFPDDPDETVDTDHDGVGDNADNCRTNVNPGQENSDGDDAGNACDAFPDNRNETVDSDADGVGDNSDNCPDVSNADQANSDSNPEGDACQSVDPWVPAGCPTPTTEVIRSDFDWSTLQAPAYNLRVNRNQSLSVKVEANTAGKYGVFSTVQSTLGGSEDRYVAISRCPGVFSGPELICAADGDKLGAGTKFKIGVTQRGYCRLEQGQTYFFNLWHANPNDNGGFTQTCPSGRNCYFNSNWYHN